MSYDDFWFIETRNQSKNLQRYFLWGILLFIFVTVGSIICIRSMYADISYKVMTDVPLIKVDEAKATKTNGYVKGTVSNLAEEEIKEKNIKFTFYNEKDKNVGEEYIKLNTLGASSSKTYEVKFRLSNVERVEITIE